MYTYIGDRMTDQAYKGRQCKAIKRADGKCIRGRNSNMLVEFDNGEKAVILARLLRKKK